MLRINTRTQEEIEDFDCQLSHMNTDSLCLTTIRVLQQTIHCWNIEVKKQYIIYGDHICGLRHKISKLALPAYYNYLEQHPEYWGLEDKACDNTVLELCVATRDGDVVLTDKATIIIEATFFMMIGIAELNRDLLVRSLFFIAEIYEEWSEFINIVMGVQEKNGAGGNMDGSNTEENNKEE